jgi:hypothetical protein
LINVQLADTLLKILNLEYHNAFLSFQNLSQIGEFLLDRFSLSANCKYFRIYKKKRSWTIVLGENVSGLLSIHEPVIPNTVFLVMTHLDCTSQETTEFLHFHTLHSRSTRPVVSCQVLVEVMACLLEVTGNTHSKNNTKKSTGPMSSFKCGTYDLLTSLHGRALNWGTSCRHVQAKLK